MISGTTAKVLSAENLSASYNKKQVLHGINTTFSDSNFYCIMATMKLTGRISKIKRMRISVAKSYR